MNDCANSTPSVRVEWKETRREEAFLISGELGPTGEWVFYERSAWEVRWYRVPNSEALITAAERALQAGCGGGSPRSRAHHA